MFPASRHSRIVMVAAILSFVCIGSPRAWADTIVDWNATVFDQSAMSNGPRTQSATLSGIGSAVQFSSEGVLGAASFDVGILAADTVSIGAFAFEDAFSAYAYGTATVTNSFQVVSNEAPAGTPITVLLTTSLNGDVSANNTFGGNSAEFTDPFGSQSATPPPNQSIYIPISDSGQQAFRAYVGETFFVDANFEFNVMAQGDEPQLEFGAANGQMTLSYTAQSLSHDATVVDAPPTPEPSSLVLVLIGIVVLAFRRGFAADA